MKDDAGGTVKLRGRLVEGVRLVFIAVLGTAGYSIGRVATSADQSSRVLLYVFLGAACGYVLGGIVGRLTLEEETRFRETLDDRDRSDAR